MRLITVLIIILIFGESQLSFAQELKCNVNINSQQIQSSDKRIFNTLQTALYQFMNSTSWSGYDYKYDEKIECSMLLTITDRYGPEEFKGTLTIASQRPVYNSTYNTVLFNTIDRDVEFKYIENEPLDFYENSFTSNLTSVFAFYAYVIIGLDFNSFTLNGGDQFLQMAQNVVNSAQNSNNKGWKSFENQKNRYWLAENLTNPSYNPIKSFYYEYHLKGLDMMHEDSDKGRANILNSLKYLQDVKKERPGLYLLQIISDSKRDEIMNVFSEGSSYEKSQTVLIMKDVDPAHSSRYQKLTQ